MANVATQQPNGILFSEPTMFRNRIINGDMRIDQRNNGAALTVNTASDSFGVDRWSASGQSADGVFTVQQSSVAPSGFSKSLLCTVTTADLTVGGTQRYFVEQKIEGFNIAELAWGTADAKAVTLSFWTRSSVTGTLGGSISNGSSRYFPFSYTINAANTWEYKTVTIAGETSGSWSSTSSLGMEVLFSLGTGYTAAANTWSNTTALAPTGSVNIIGTNTATLYITGVQLERGSSATPFEFRPYGTELALCQRYFEKSFDIGTAPAANTGDFRQGVFCAESASAANMSGRILFKVSKRPGTITTASYNPIDATNPTTWRLFTGSWQYLTPSLTASENGILVTLSGASGLSPNASYYVSGHWTASSEL